MLDMLSVVLVWHECYRVFGRQTPAVESRLDKDQRWDLLKASGHWGRKATVGVIRGVGPLRVNPRTAEYDPVLRAHCRLDSE